LWHMFRCMTCVTAILLAGCANSERHNITDCRDAALRAGENYKKEDGWHTKEIHFNQKSARCYLSLEGIERSSDAGLNYSLTSAVFDVDENREIISCVTTHIEGQKQTSTCTGPDGKQINAGEFLRLRSQYMERISN